MKVLFDVSVCLLINLQYLATSSNITGSTITDDESTTSSLPYSATPTSTSSSFLLEANYTLTTTTGYGFSSVSKTTESTFSTTFSQGNYTSTIVTVPGYESSPVSQTTPTIPWNTSTVSGDNYTWTSTTVDHGSSTAAAPQTTARISSTLPGDNCTYLDPPSLLALFPEKTSANITWWINQTDHQCIPSQLNIVCDALEEDNIYGWNWVINSSSVNVTVGEYNATVVYSYIENLSEFTNYTCEGTLMYFDIESPSANFTFQTEPEVPSPPSNLIISNITSTSFHVRWEKPVKNPGIFISYHIFAWNDGANHFVPASCNQTNRDLFNDTLEEEYLFSDASPDYNYEIVLFVENEAGNSSSINENVTTNTAGSEEPGDVLFEVEKVHEESNVINGNLSWKIPCASNGPINKFFINLEGYYLLNRSIEDVRSFFVPGNESEEYFRPFKLMPASNYTVSIHAEGIHQSGVVHRLSLITEDNVPGSPVINNITNTGSNFFVVSWSEPERKAGNITKYEIQVSPLGPLYQFDPNKCVFQNDSIIEIIEGGILTYNFTRGQPYYEYNVSVTAFTSKGSGNSSETLVTTKSSVPEQPENFTFSIEEAGNIIGLLSWEVPCNINGPIQAFIVTLNGVYAEDSSEPTTYTQTVQYEKDVSVYILDVQLLEAYSYKANVWIILTDNTHGEKATENITTPDGYPGAPTVSLSEIAEKSFKISWKPPNTKMGKISAYRVNITSQGPAFETHCDLTDTSHFSNITDGNRTEIQFTKGKPYYHYTVSVQASTSKGFGKDSESSVTTAQSVPENVKLPHPPEFTYPTDEEYNAYVNISFEKPCHLNGPLKHFELILNGTRADYMPDMQRKQSLEHYFVCDLRPEYNYSFSIKTVNERYSIATLPRYFLAPAGVPPLPSKPFNLNIEKTSSSAKATLKKEDFSESAGNITYFALFLSDKNITGGDFDSWNGMEWPQVPSVEDGIYYQLTEDWWDPFKDVDNITIDIGSNADCKETYCNKPLEKNKEYYLIIRLFTRNFYRNSPTIYFKTDDISKLGAILGIIFGLLGLALLGVAGFILWKKKLVKLPSFNSRKSSAGPSNSSGTAIPIHKFAQYCKNLENNPEKYAEQYTLLGEKAKEAVRMHTMVYAGLTENRRKNRYTNILPYDETRVKLLIEEDDEIGSDYINASYIKGYSGKVEYIATQGPLQQTCRDFWKMVIQENVSIIVMVTQFVEQNKEKCYKYFPNNHESMIIGEDMEVRCAMELDFGTYCVRTLQVKKDTTQVSVTHMQYLDWPDFSVPTGTETMLQFCYQLRQRLRIEGGCVIIHCRSYLAERYQILALNEDVSHAISIISGAPQGSILRPILFLILGAGVGRTGTLIVTDILLQDIKAGNNIDIFNAVLELRKQRTHMVQTQKQYVYIHNLIKDSLDQSQMSALSENIEPLYENVPVLQMKHSDDSLTNKGKEVESQF